MLEWTERSEKRGLDPLGMQNAGVALYQQLLPGISNVTLRMRYYGLYCWLSDAYARQSGSTDPAVWQVWVRRCEAVYALASSVAGNEAGVAGVEWAAEALKEAGESINFVAATQTQGPRLYLRQGMGVFGGAYASQLDEMGLMAQAVGHTILVRTPDLGQRAALAFVEAIGPDAAQILGAAIATGTIPRSDLARLAPALPTTIDADHDEAELYREVLLGAGSDRPNDRSRRASLLLILRLARTIGARPTPDQVRWALFDNALGDLPELLEAQRLRWEAYHAHDLIQLAYAGLLRWALDRLGEEDGRVDLNALAELSTEQLTSRSALPAQTTWQDWVSGSRDQPDYRLMATGLGRTAANGTIGVDQARDSLVVIAALQARLADRPDLVAEIGRSLPASEFARTIRGEMAWFERYPERTLRETLFALVNERVLRRHTWVAMQKFRRRDYTFLFEADDGVLRLRAKYSPVLTTPRLGPSINMLADVGLLDASGVTARGAVLADAVA